MPPQPSHHTVHKLLDKSQPQGQNWRRMSIFLDKIIPLFVYPTGFIVVSALLCLLFLAWNWRRAAVTCLLVGTLYVWLCATPVFSRLLADSLEGDYLTRTVEQMPQADLIVMLGGTLSPPGQWNPYGDLDSSAARITETARLYRAGKAPQVLISGGQLFPVAGRASEAEMVRALLMDFGVPESAIIVETLSRNTYENATGTARMLQKQPGASVLLVTSAWHMQRAVAVFRRAGVTVVPAPTDSFRAQLADSIPFGYLPDVDALRISTLCIKEWIGMAVYKLRGWA